MSSAVGGNNAFPSLETIANLFRYIVNDSLNLGAGIINVDSNPDLMTNMNSAIRDLYSDLRNIGDPQLLKDNYIVSNLPVVHGPQGIGSPSPETQVSLSYAGFFDGTIQWPNYTLPIDCVNPLRLWQRITGSGDVFHPMSYAQNGLQPWNQGITLGQWEWRENALWMNGSLSNMDMRLRYTATYPDYFGSSLVLADTYIPIQNCQNAIAYKMATTYAIRLSPMMLQMAQSQADLYTMKLKNETVRAMQNKDYTRAEWGAGDTGNSTLVQL